MEIHEGSGAYALFIYREHEDSGTAPFNLDVYFSNWRLGTIIIFPRDSKLI